MKLKVLVTAILCSVSPLSASLITGQVWSVSEAAANSATLASVPATAPDATFSIPNGPIDFLSGNLYTVGEFITNGGGVCFGAYCSSSLDDGFHGTIIQLLGTVSVTNGQNFTVTHDDGLTLIVGGLDLGFSAGPSSGNTTVNTYNGPTGNLPFTLVYGECCGSPARLQTSLPLVATATPEPATFILFGAGLLLLGTVASRIRRRS